MKVRAPFKISYGGPQRFEVWGWGLGYLPMGILAFGYNLRGALWAMPPGTWWDIGRKGHLEVRSVKRP